MLLAAAGSMPTPGQVLTEEQFLDDALVSTAPGFAGPATAAAEAEIAAAAGLRRQAVVLANPEITWERENPDAAASQDTWRLSWRLPFDGRRHRVTAADAEVAAARSELEAAHLAARLEMRALFSTWYLATERQAVLHTHLERTGRLAGWLRARAEAGEAAGVAAQRLDLEVDVLRQEAGAASAQARAGRVAAAAWSLLVTADVTPARPPLPPPPGTADVNDRADVAALAHRVAAAEARYRLQRRVLAPPEISAGWLEISDRPQSFAGPVFGVSWPLPLFNRNQGTRQAAAAEADRARADLELARRRASQQAQAALAAYTDLFAVTADSDTGDSDTGDSDTGTADDGTAGDAEADLVDAMLAAFAAGEASLTDVLDTSRATRDVLMARLDMLELALAAERELETALGRPLSYGGSR